MKNIEICFKEYNCEICNKKYSSYQSLWIHNKKFHILNSQPKGQHFDHFEGKHGKHSKHSLDSNENKEYKCNKCNNSYKHKQSKSRHEKKCEKEIIIKENTLYKIEKNQELIQKKLDKILIEKQKTKETNQEINGDHNIINSVNVINNFNNDNLSYITPDFFRNLLKETLFEEDHYKVLPKVIEEVKFNKEHTENNNVKLKDKSKYGEVYTEDGWKKIDDKKLIEHLVQKGYQLYVKLSDIHKDQIIKRYIDSNENFKDNFLNGTIENDVEDVMKETVIRGTKKIKKYDRNEREKEMMKEIIL